MNDLGPLKPPELSADDFIRELAAAQNWGMMLDPLGSGRQLLMIVTNGLPDAAYYGPSPVMMEPWELEEFSAKIEEAISKRAAFDTPRE